MTNEELVEFLCNISDCTKNRCRMYKECNDGDKKIVYTLLNLIWIIQKIIVLMITYGNYKR